jgi:hypothetical protein
MRDEKAGSSHRTGSKAQTSSRRQLDFVEHTDDEGEALSFEALLDRVQSLCCARRLDDEETRRIKAKAREPGGRGHTDLAGKRPRPAPQPPWPAGLRPGRFESLEATHSQTRRKADPDGPIGRRIAAGARSDALHFVNGVGLEPPRQQRIE